MGRSVVFAAFVAAVLSSGVRAGEHTFDSNGVTISYLDEGKGEAVVLLHGFTGSAEMWTKMPLAEAQLLPTLAKEYRVIALDFRGHGRSQKPHDPKKYGGELAADVVRLLDHLKVKKAHVVGYSMGAIVAGKLLVSHPDRLRSVTFGGAAPLLRPPQPFVDVVTATAESLDRGKGIGPLVLGLLPADGPKLTPAQAAVMSQLYLGSQDQKALAAVLRGFVGFEVTAAQLKANRVPVQFVYGSREAPMLVEVITAARAALPGAGVKVVDRGDHISTAASAEFVKAVQEFLRAHRE